MKRRTAREKAVQSLYQMEMNDTTAELAIEAVMENVDGEQKQVEFLAQLVHGAWQYRQEIDELLSGYLIGWKLDRLSRVDKQILRLAAYEMIYDRSSPPKVVVNEAVDLAKHFGTEESGKFVNGVLGKMINEVDEIIGRG